MPCHCHLRRCSRPWSRPTGPLDSCKHNALMPLKLFPHYWSLEGKPLVTDEFTHKEPVTHNFDVFLSNLFKKKQSSLIWDSMTLKRWCVYFNGLVQDCSNSIANAHALLQSYTKPSICQQAGTEIFKLYFNYYFTRNITGDQIWLFVSLGI